MDEAFQYCASQRVTVSSFTHLCKASSASGELIILDIYATFEYFLTQIIQPSVGRKLFAAGFASCWAQMSESSQEQLVRSLKTAFSSQNIPPEILATLLNLVSWSCV